MFSFEKLTQFTKQVFVCMGCSDKDAEQASSVLCAADLRGVDSHGVARLSGYVALWEKGRINTKPNIAMTHQTPSTATLNGDKALGLVVSPQAMKIAIEKAKQVGSSWVAVSNSNHFGIAGYYSMLAAKENMIGISMTNASPLVAPTFSTERLLGTNPICVAIPAGKYPPFVADFSTTTASNGKLEILQRQKKLAPIGWIQDKQGNASNSPEELKSGGALLPLGSDRERSSHKGYCLGAMVDIFSGVLSGANYGPWVPPFVSFLNPLDNLPGKGIGHFFGAIRVDAFRQLNDFKNNMDKWIEKFKGSASVNEQNKVLIPGEPERELEKERKKNGIPLLEPVVKDLKQLAVKFDIDF